MYTINDINKNIVELILSEKLYKKSNMLFLIGENSTGKSEIAKMVEKDSDIKILDNFNGTYEEIPKNEKVLVVTHNWRRFLPQLNGYENFIVTQNNDLYGIIDAHILYSCDTSCYNWKNDFSKFLHIAISGCWNDLVEYYYQEYIKTIDVNLNSNKLMIREIRSWIEYSETQNN